MVLFIFLLFCCGSSLEHTRNCGFVRVNFWLTHSRMRRWFLSLPLGRLSKCCYGIFFSGRRHIWVYFVKSVVKLFNFLPRPVRSLTSHRFSRDLELLLVYHFSSLITVLDRYWTLAFVELNSGLTAFSASNSFVLSERNFKLMSSWSAFLASKGSCFLRVLVCWIYLTVLSYSLNLRYFRYFYRNSFGTY